MRMMMRNIAVLMMIAMLGGCASEPLPTYTWNSPAEAMAILNCRAARLHTLTAQGTVTLTRRDGQSVRFDAALVIQPPDRLRLRAWKFGEAVLDVTIRPDGVWVWIADRAGEDAKRDLPKLLGGGAVRELGTLLAGSVTGEAKRDDDALEIVNNLSDKVRVTAKVDPRTLVVREYDVSRSSGETVERVVLSEYEPAGPTVWPRRIEAVGPQGRIDVELGEVRVNEPLNRAAFEAPARAQKQD